jgi:hypothetical protein
MGLELTEWTVVLKLIHHRCFCILDGIAIWIPVCRRNPPALIHQSVVQKKPRITVNADKAHLFLYLDHDQVSLPF